MSDKKSGTDNSDTSADSKDSRSTAESARRILLAGIGAYGRAFMEAQEALKDVRGKSSDVFDELVQKGEMMETMFEHKSKQVGQHIKERTGASAQSLDDRIAKMRERLTKSRSGETDTDDLAARIDIVEAKLDKLTAMIEAQAKPAAKKSTPANKTTAKKTTAKKTAAKKTAAKKTTRTNKTTKPTAKKS